MNKLYYKIKIITAIFALAVLQLVGTQAPEALAAQGCSLNSFYGTVNIDGVPTDGATVTLTDLTNGAPALTAITSGGGLYLIESANLTTCANAGDHIQLEASINGLTATTFVNYATQAATNVDLSISSLVLTSISLTPTTINPLDIGATQQFIATALDQNGVAMNPQPILVWASSMPNVATIDQTGLMTAVAPGISIISVGNGPVIASLSVTVNPPTPVLTTINVTPTTASINTGATQQFTATALDQNGVAMNPQPTFTWTSSDITLATVDAMGMATGVAAGGPVTITAASGAISGTASLTVTTPVVVPVLTTINVTPTTASINTGATQQFTATALDQNGAPIVATVTWVSSDPAAGTIDAATGLFTAVGAGTTTISATSGAISGTASVMVSTPVIVPILTTINVSPSSSSVLVGATQQFTATALDQNGVAMNPQPTFTWSSADAMVATVDAMGMATGVAAGGHVTITAASGAISGTASLTVTTPVSNNPVVSALPITGTYNKAINVVLSATNSGTILYTLDNSVPTCSTGTPYINPIHVTSTANIKAIACNGNLMSTVTDFNYVVNYKITEKELNELFNDDIFECGATSTNTSTHEIYIHQEVEMEAEDHSGSSSVKFAPGTIITRDDDSMFDATKLVAQSEPEDSLSGFSDSRIKVLGALHMGLPNLGLKFNPAVQLSIVVGDSFNGKTLNLYRSVDGKTNWTDVGLSPNTCVVTNGRCNFSATKASHYAATQIQVAQSSGSGNGGGGGGGRSYSSNYAPASPAISVSNIDKDNQTVTLKLSATNNPTQIAISKDNSFSGVSFVPFTDTATWNFGDNTGDIKVYAKFRNSYGDTVANASFTVPAASVQKQAVKTPVAPQQTNQIQGEVLGVKITRLDELANALKMGNRGQKVQELQDELKKMGLFPTTVKSTGYYGPITDSAVKKYLVGKTTDNTPVKDLLSVLTFGTRGNNVQKLQDELKKMGLFPTTVKSTGYYGPITDSAVKKYLASRS